MLNILIGRLNKQFVSERVHMLVELFLCTLNHKSNGENAMKN